MRNISLLLIIGICTSCYKTIELEDFDSKAWKTNAPCSEYRSASVNHLMNNMDILLEATQNEIESLLGAADEHELYERNQKFFHYRLTPADSCSVKPSSIRFLSIRFNAIGRASDIQVVIRDN